MKYVLIIIAFLPFCVSIAQPENNYKQASQLYEKQEFAAALPEINEAIKADPGNFEYLYLRGRIQLKLKEPKLAMEDYTKAAANGINSTEFFYDRAYAHFLNGTYKEGIADFNEVLKREPKHVNALFYRSQIFQEQGNTNQAMTDLNKVIEIKPDFVEAYLERAQISFEAENFKFCIKDCNKVIELNPNFADAYYYRGIARGGVEKDKDAIDDFNKAIELNENHDEALMARGAAKLYLGNKKGACMDWNRAAKLGNDEAEIMFENSCLE